MCNELRIKLNTYSEAIASMWYLQIIGIYV
jgi:hypothetical protein